MPPSASRSDSNLLAWAYPFLLAAGLCSLLATYPHASIRPAQPYKVELFLSAFGIIVGTWLLTKYRSKDSAIELTLNSTVISFLVFAAFSVVSALWADSTAGVAHHSLLWLFYICVLLIFSKLSTTDFAFKLFVSITIIIGLFTVIDHLSVVEFAVSEGTIRIRYGKYAEMLVTFMPLLWAAALWSKTKRLKILLIAVASLNWLAVMLSLSRGAFVAGIAGMILFTALMLVLGGKRSRKPAVIIAAIWLVLTVGTQAVFTYFSQVPSTTAYISGSVDPDNTNIEMRKFTWQLAFALFRQQPILGVGADNFGVNVTEARRAYRDSSPDSPTAEIAEDYLIERAHNEYFQILSELGIAGFVLFCIPFALFKMRFLSNLRRRRLRITPFAAAAIGGLSAFALSSLTSSFSFRSIQNGVVFSVVLGLLIGHIEKKKRTERQLPALALPTLIIAASVALGIFSVTRAAAEYFVYQAERAEQHHYEEQFRRAFLFDPGYAGAFYILAGRKAADGEHEAAAYNFSKAVKLGIATSDTFVQLARSYEKTGAINDAENALLRGLSIYPRSVYLNAVYTEFLQKQGRPDEAVRQEEKALAINSKQASGWLLLLREGATAAFYTAEKDKTIAKPADLRPASAVTQYVEPIPYQ
ncbi:MAG: O-antigen ligase family protein [Acidobacteriota bacterium]|nr:MAG: O-antigen ligase family protein [Acidobacteriota bacterium]